MSRKRVGVAVAIALLVGLLLFLAVRSPDSRSASAPAPVDQTTPSLPRSDRALPPQQLVAATEPVVEEITVEKTEVCSGEDNLVTVRLAGDHQNDENIRITMPGLGGAGRQMPFILGLTAAKQQPEMPEVVVSGRDGALATVKVPTVTVKDCIPGPSLSVEVALVANTSATFALTATVRNPGPTAFKPVQWHWDFGDGARRHDQGSNRRAQLRRPAAKDADVELPRPCARRRRGRSRAARPPRLSTILRGCSRKPSSSSPPSSALAFRDRRRRAGRPARPHPPRVRPAGHRSNVSRSSASATTSRASRRCRRPTWIRARSWAPT